MNRSRRSLVLGAALTLLVLASGVHPAAAGVPPAQATQAQRDDALQHFKAGKEAADANNLEVAVTEFRASLDVIESPNTRLKLARALRDAGKLAEAWTEYRRTQDDAKALAEYAKAGEAATTEQAEVQRKIGLVTVELRNAPVGAKLEVGGRAVPLEDWSKPVAVAPGPVDAVLSASGAERARQSVTVNAGARATITLAAGAGAAAAVASSPSEAVPVEPALPPEPPPPPPSSSKLRPFAYAAGGLGVAGMATFAVFGVLAQSTYNDLQNICHGAACPPGHEDEISRGRTDQTVAKVALVTGAVGLAGGVTLFVLSFRSKAADHPSDAGASLVFGPGWIGLGGTL